jgi:2-dehydropantoate 2-reductase
LERGRKTEVEWLNGEVLRLAANHGIAAPINARVRELIKLAEQGGRKDYSAEELLAAIR